MGDLRIGALAVSVALVFLIGGCSKKEWKQKTYEKAGFTVYMPCDPTTSSDFQKIGNTASLTMTNYSCSPGALSGQNYTVVVGTYSDWSMGQVTFDMDAAIESARASIKSQGGTIVSENEVQLGGKDGYEFRVTANDMTSHMQVTVNEEKFTFYLLELAAKPGKETDADATNFFGTFQLL